MSIISDIVGMSNPSVGTPGAVGTPGSSSQPQYGTGLYPAAAQWFNAPIQGYFPGPTVAGFTPMQEQAWEQSIANLQGAVPVAQQQAQQAQAAYDRFAGFDPFTNPALEQSVEAMQQAAQRAYDRSVPLQTASQAIGAGGYGGSRQGIAEGIAQGDFLSSLNRATADMYTSAYNQGLGRQTALLQSTPQMLQAANVLAMQPTEIGNMLAQAYGNIGESQQNMLQRQLDAEKSRWDFMRLAPIEKLQVYSGLLQPGMASGLATQSTTNPNVSNPFANALGGASLGLGVWNQFQNAQPTTTPNPMTGYGGFQGLGIGNPSSYTP